MNDLGLNLTWDAVFNVWLGWLLWLFEPGMANRFALSVVLVTILCYAGLMASKFGLAEPLTEEN